MDLKKKSLELGLRMRRFRVKQGLSAEEVARRIGVSPSTYRDWESGRPIKGEHYPLICTVLKCGLSELLGTSQTKEIAISEELRKVEESLSVIRTLF